MFFGAGSSSRDLSFIVEDDDPDDDVSRSKGQGQGRTRLIPSTERTPATTAMTTVSSMDDNHDLDPAMNPPVKIRGQGHGERGRGRLRRPTIHEPAGGGRYRFRGHARSKSSSAVTYHAGLLASLTVVAAAMTL